MMGMENQGLLIEALEFILLCDSFLVWFKEV